MGLKLRSHPSQPGRLLLLLSLVLIGSASLAAEPGWTPISRDPGPPAATAETPETLPGLTERETEIARLVAAGKRSSEIAEQLFVSVRTVDNHLAAIYRKLGVKSRAHVVAFVMENA